MIRLATTSDLPRILEVYAVARQLMRESGNPNQWGDHFPPEDLLRSDIPKEQLYVRWMHSWTYVGRLYSEFVWGRT